MVSILIASWYIKHPGLNISPKVFIKRHGFTQVLKALVNKDQGFFVLLKKCLIPLLPFFSQLKIKLFIFPYLLYSLKNWTYLMHNFTIPTLAWQIKLLTSMTTLKLVVVGEVRQQNFLLWHSIHYYLGRQYCKIVRCNEKMFITFRTEWPLNHLWAPAAPNMSTLRV